MANPNLVVKVKQGKLQGSEKKSIHNGKVFYNFSGIPYAQPPVGNLRFQPPVPSTNWDEIRDATTERDMCIQSKDGIQFEGTEDCLYLNVYTTQLPNSDKSSAPLKPVIVYVHGGAFLTGSGSASEFSPDYLMDYDVVVVTLNYRLHVLGFLNMNISQCSGNVGLKDQLLALKWVNQNVQYFGGDANNVTLVGQSAGAASVHLHTLSPLSKGLFQRAIIQSGNATCKWGFAADQTDIGFKIGKLLGCETNDPNTLMQFLAQQSAEALTAAGIQLQTQIKQESPRICVVIPFKPSLEIVGQDKFLPDVPTNLMQKDQSVPLIAGLNSREGIVSVIGLTEDFLKQLNVDFTPIIRDNMVCNSAMLSEIASKVKQFHFGDKTIGYETLAAYVDLCTDLLFQNYYASVDFIINANSPQPVYEYEFAFDGKFNAFKTLVKKALKTEVQGASHSDELGYLFYPETTFPQPQFEEPETSVIENICKMWTNFAKTGNPNGVDKKINVNWIPSSSAKRCFLRITDKLQLVEGRIFPSRFDLWDELLPKMTSQ